ncbi:MAG TPA: hypothetical protein V6D48_10510 [Oculatellaceae cyanobacterium]
MNQAFQLIVFLPSVADAIASVRGLPLEPVHLNLCFNLNLLQI